MAFDVKVENRDFRLLVAKLRRFRAWTSERLRAEAIDGARELRDEIVRRASGHPGPEIVTGEYTTSWFVEVGGGLLAPWIVAVSTDQEQWRRLEFGFVGVDALGRYYNQPSFPHIIPAIDFIGPHVARRFEQSLPQGWEAA